MPGQGRSFRRTVAKFWNLRPLPPKIEVSSTVVFVDGIYLARNACILICCNEKHVLGWYVDMNILGFGMLYYNEYLVL